MSGRGKPDRVRSPGPYHDTLWVPLAFALIQDIVDVPLRFELVFWPELLQSLQSSLSCSNRLRRPLAGTPTCIHCGYLTEDLFWMGGPSALAKEMLQPDPSQCFEIRPIYSQPTDMVVLRYKRPNRSQGGRVGRVLNFVGSYSSSEQHAHEEVLQLASGERFIDEGQAGPETRSAPFRRADRLVCCRLPAGTLWRRTS